MESRIRGLFTKKSTSRRNAQELKTSAYDSAIALREPIKGTYPVAGNGPKTLEDIQRERGQKGGRVSISSVAPAPVVARSRRESTRPQTAPHTGFASGHDNARTRSGNPMRSPPNFSRKQPPDADRDSNSSRPQSNRIIAYAASPDPQPPQSPSAYVDILDAASTINPSRHSSRNRTKASGRRDYGEDVADRNIADFGGVDLSSPQYSYLREVYARDKLKVNHKRDSSTWGNVVGPTQAGDASNDDIIYHDQLHHTPAHSRNTSGQTTSNTRPTPTLRTSSLTSTSLRDYGIRAQAAKSPPPAPTAFGRPTTTPRRASRTTATKSYVPSQGYDMDEDSAVSPQIPRTRAVSTSKPAEGAKAAAVAAAVASNKRGKQERDNYTPTPPLPASSRFARQQNLPTPPISPSTASSSSPRTRPNTDKGLPPTPRRRSRGLSASYSAFPPQANNNRDSHSSMNTSDSSIDRHSPAYSNRRRDDLVVEGSPYAPNLEGVVDLTNTTDTTVHTKTAPAITHEHVTPKVHHIREERIEREIHNYDIIHRIQPIIDVEVLPTRHYVPTADGTLREISADEIPGRQGHWHVAPGAGSTTTATSADATSESYPPPNLTSQAQPPSKVHSHRYMDRDGVRYEESVHLHNANHEVGGYATRQTVPLDMSRPPVPRLNKNFVDNDHERSYRGGRTTHANRSHEAEEYDGTTTDEEPKEGEELLFRESGYGFGGMLPGLEEPSPLAGLDTTRQTGVIGRRTSGPLPGAVNQSSGSVRRKSLPGLKKEIVKGVPGGMPGGTVKAQRTTDGDRSADVVQDNNGAGVGEATKFLRRQRASGSGSVVGGHSHSSSVDDVGKQLEGLSVEQKEKGREFPLA